MTQAAHTFNTLGPSEVAAMWVKWWERGDKCIQVEGRHFEKNLKTNKFDTPEIALF